MAAASAASRELLMQTHEQAIRRTDEPHRGYERSLGWSDRATRFWLLFEAVELPFRSLTADMALNHCGQRATWATAMQTVPDLACVIPVSYSVSRRIAPKQ